MHRALVISSRYPEDSGYPNLPTWAANAELLAGRLSHQGYELERLGPGEDLLRALRTALRTTDKAQSLLIYFVGYLVLTDEGEPAVVLSDATATALRLGQLAERAGRNFGRVLFVVDAVRGTPSRSVNAATNGRVFPSTEKALATLAVEITVPDNVGLLVGVRKWADDDHSGLPFSELMDAAIRELSTSSEPSTSSDFSDWLDERETLGTFSLTAHHSDPEFVVLPRRRFPSSPHALVPESDDFAPARSRLDSLPPPLPGERALAGSPPPLAASISPSPILVPPPPPLPTLQMNAAPGYGAHASSASFVLPAPVAIAGSIPPLPSAPPLPTPSPYLTAGPTTLPPPPAPRTIEAPPPLPTAQDMAPLPSLPPLPVFPVRDPIVTLPAPPLYATQVIPSPIVSVAPPPPLPGTPATLPAPEPVWPASWQQSSAPPGPPQPSVYPAQSYPAQSYSTEGSAEFAGFAQQLLDEPAPVVQGALPANSELPASSEPALVNSVPPAANSVLPQSVAQATPRVVAIESWPPAAPEVPQAESLDEAAWLARARHALHSGDGETALYAAEQCLALFPDSVQALQIAALELARGGRWAQLVGLYEQLIGHLSDSASIAQLCGAAARVYREQLGDDVQARRILNHGLTLAPTNQNVLLELVELEQLRGDTARAVDFSKRALASNPLSSRAAATALQCFQHAGHQDLTRVAALLLSFLGHAQPNELALLEQTRVQNLPQPGRAVGATDFALGLSATDVDPGLVQLFSLLAEPMREIALPKAKEQQRLLSTLKAEDVATSTTTLTRAFGWTCRFLSINPPLLYLTDGDTPPEPLAVSQLTWGVGKGLGRGLSLAELAFLWGRALGRARPESRILFVCPTLKDLQLVLDAARAAVELPGELSADAKKLAKALKKRVERPVWELVKSTLVARPAARLSLDLEAFRARAELSANRVGLVACDDLEVAIRMLQRFPVATELTREAHASDLFTYACSDTYLELRRQLGLAR